MVPQRIVALAITKMVDLETCFYNMDTRIPCNRVHRSFSKLERILILMIQRAKRINIENFNFYNTFQHFGSNVVLAIKCMNFEDLFLIKVIHFYVKKHMNARYT
jgi:hypothetical protein